MFDSYYDIYRGVVCYVRVVDGTLSAGDRIRFVVTGETHGTEEVGVITPKAVAVQSLGPGEVGLSHHRRQGHRPDQGRRHRHLGSQLRPPSPCPAMPSRSRWSTPGLFPTDGDDFERLREALEKLKLNDASLQYEPESSRALGFGFRLGFLGLLHMEIVRERLEREYNLDLVATAPSVAFRVGLTNGRDARDQVAPGPARRRFATSDRGAVRQDDDHLSIGIHRSDHGTGPEPSEANTSHSTTSRPSGWS